MATVGMTDLGFPTHNREDYTDLTAYQALKNAQRTEFGYRPLVYIGPPYSGDTAANIELARQICAHAVASRVIPLASHLFSRSS